MLDTGTTPTRLALVRHGRSSHVQVGWLDARGFRAWREAYEAAGIVVDQGAPPELERLVACSDVLVSSDTPRAAESARVLAGDRETIVTPLLRELALEGPELGRLRFPLLAWAVLVGCRTLLLRLRRRYPTPADAARLDLATDWLADLGAQHSLVVAVTHASFRAELARRLIQKGWRAEPGRRTLRHWSVWLFTRPRT